MLHWCNSLHRRDSGSINILDYVDEIDVNRYHYNSATNARYLLLQPNEDTLLDLNIRAAVLDMTQYVLKENKTLMLHLAYVSNQSDYREMIFSILPYIDFLFISQKDIILLGLYLYDEVECTVDFIADKLRKYTKLNRIRPRILVVLGDQINSPIYYYIGAGIHKTFIAPAYNNLSKSSSITDEVSTDYNHIIFYERISAFCMGFLIQLVRLEKQIYLIHDTLHLGRSDPQLYLSTEIYGNIDNASVSSRSSVSSSTIISNNSSKITKKSLRLDSISTSTFRHQTKSAILDNNKNNDKNTQYIPQKEKDKYNGILGLKVVKDTTPFNLSDSIHQRLVCPSYPKTISDSLSKLITPAISSLNSYSARSLVLSRGNTFSRGNTLTRDGKTRRLNKPFFQEIEKTPAGTIRKNTLIDGFVKDAMTGLLNDVPPIVCAEKGIYDCILQGYYNMLTINE